MFALDEFINEKLNFITNTELNKENENKPMTSLTDTS